MIDKFYKNFEIRDYLGDDQINNKKIIDCSLGTNPFICKGYTNPNYPKLKAQLLRNISKKMNVNIDNENIAFSSWHNGSNKKRVSIFN